MKIKLHFTQIYALAAFLCLLFPVLARAQFTFTTNTPYPFTNSTITVSGYTGTNSVLVIPDTTNGLPVTGIANAAFFGNTNLTSVAFGTNLANIGNQAFENCKNLTNVSLSTGLNGLGDQAFAGCISLANFIFPDNSNSTTSMGSFVFQYCQELSTVTLGSSLKNLGAYAFQYCPKLTNVTIANGVTSIYDFAFANCSALTSITFAASVTNIGASIFLSCPKMSALSVDSNNPAYVTLNGALLNKSLTMLLAYPATRYGNYTVPDGVTNIPNYTFQNCSGLTSVTLPNGLRNIGNYSFEYCSNLTDINFPNGLTNIGQFAFAGCSTLTSVIIPDSVRAIQISGFDDCESLTSLTLPNASCFLYDYSFYGSGLTNLNIPNGIGLGYECFASSTNLTNVNIGNSSITYDVFSGCTSLQNINVDPAATQYSSLGGVYFNKNQTTLIIYPDANGQNYSIPQGVTSLGNLAFARANITNLSIPSSLINIGNIPFLLCSSLVAINVDTNNPNYSSRNGIVFNKNLTSILVYPPGLNGSYTIPTGVTSIGNTAFEYCHGLTSIMIPFGVTTIGASAFYDCTSLTNISLPNSLTSIASGGAFAGCTKLLNITIPGSVTNIGSSAFDSCTKLAAVYFQGKPPKTDSTLFYGGDPVTIYYLPGNTGWTNTYSLRPTALWKPSIQSTDASFGIRSNRFSFNVNWAPGSNVIVQASTDLINPNWQPIQTNTLTNGSFYFTDTQSSTYPNRFYRIRSP